VSFFLANFLKIYYIITQITLRKQGVDTPCFLSVIEEKFRNNLKFYDYFKKYNGIEFKSPVDSFKIEIDKYKLGFYLNGILLQ